MFKLDLKNKVAVSLSKASTYIPQCHLFPRFKTHWLGMWGGMVGSGHSLWLSGVKHMLMDHRPQNLGWKPTRD